MAINAPSSQIVLCTGPRHALLSLALEPPDLEQRLTRGEALPARVEPSRECKERREGLHAHGVRGWQDAVGEREDFADEERDLGGG